MQAYHKSHIFELQYSHVSILDVLHVPTPAININGVTGASYCDTLQLNSTSAPAMIQSQLYYQKDKLMVSVRTGS